MIVIRVSDYATEKRALGYLAGRFSLTTRKGGVVLAPHTALGGLATESIWFPVEGSYEQNVPAIRDFAATLVQ